VSSLRKGVPPDRVFEKMENMIALAVVLFIIGLVLLFLGLFVAAAKFLLWVGIVLLVIGVIVGLFRFLRRHV
jgi:uncharacterized membrane protein HdeD (DUF308 family)